MQKKDGWDKFQIWINFAAVAVIAGVGLIVDSTLKNREVNLKYVQVAVDILRVKPEESSKNLRKWAIDVINEYSKIPLSLEAQEELKTNALPVGNYLADPQGNIITDPNGNPITTPVNTTDAPIRSHH